MRKVLNNKIINIASNFIPMEYPEALQYIYSQLPMFHRIGKAAYKSDLGNTLILDDYFGQPHKKFKTIHVGGTNGKGSTSHMLASILQQAGYRVGLYTSPHLRDFRERIRINGQMIPKDEVSSFVSLHKEFLDRVKPSFFEMSVAMAFDYFARMQVDIAVIEVGLGGRLDSTNIVNPVLSIITNIGWDHTDLLGGTLQKIAAEKAGIIKPNTPVIISQYQAEVAEIFQTKARESRAPIIFADQQVNILEQSIVSNNLQQFKYAKGSLEFSIELDLMGNYQRYNLPGVLKSIEVLNDNGFSIKETDLAEGLKRVQELTGLMGRWQKLSDNPLIYCDTGHNVDGIRLVVEQINRTPHNQLHMVIGAVADKDITGMLSLLPQNAIYYFTQASIPRALNHSELQKQAFTLGLKGDAFPTVAEALTAAKLAAKPNDLIFVGGSTFVVAEVV